MCLKPVTLFSLEIKVLLVFISLAVMEAVHCLRNKMLKVSSIKKGCFQCFDVAMKIGRDALSSVEGTSNTFPHFSLKYLLMTPLTTSLKKFTRTANYLISILNFSSSTTVMSTKTQCSVSKS